MLAFPSFATNCSPPCSQIVQVLNLPPIILRMIQDPLDPFLTVYIILNIPQLSSISSPDDILRILQAVLRPSICFSVSPLEAIGIQIVDEARPG